MNEPIYADIQNLIYEAGLLRPDERIVLMAESYVLLEHYTGKTYIYRMVELTTLKARRLFARQRPLTGSDHQKAIDKMLSQTAPLEQEVAQQKPQDRARDLLRHIFTKILPQHGMMYRENQAALALEMLEGIRLGKLGLDEAEVGTGKTHAYILAAAVYNLFTAQKETTIISTSTIALQKALTEEYIPQISDILMEHRIIDKPLSFIVRKGKGHYACDDRVRCYQSSITHNNRMEDQELIELLSSRMSDSCPLDLDSLPLSDYVKNRICVEQCHFNCDLSAVCRYRNFIRKAQTLCYDFQIANHNLVLADVLGQKSGRKRLFPTGGIIIFDEAHKLLDAARQMYGISLENTELERMVSEIYRSIGTNNADRTEIKRLCEELLIQNSLLFETVRRNAGVGYDNSCHAIRLDFKCILTIKTLTAVLRRLSVLFFTTNYTKKRLYGRLVASMERLMDKLAVFFHHSESILWLEKTGTTVCRICALSKKLDTLLYEDIWNAGTPYILTSGTLSVGGDFSHFKRNNGIGHVDSHRIYEVSKASPFHYMDHALLYLPQDIPFPKTTEAGYFQAVVDRVVELITATHGHTLVLFTSYRMMEQVHAELENRISAFPLFRMGRGRLDAITAFRKSGNGVLLASDSAGEGIDLAGDILSSLIVVRLPFPAPDPVLEYEKSLYSDFYSYLNEVIVPGMLIKLRQWIGRGIRRETDSCVFSILDSRANGRYKNDILAALPDMPVTNRISDVGQFLLSKKDDKYFE